MKLQTFPFLSSLIWLTGCCCLLLMWPLPRLTAQQLKLGNNITRYDSSAALEIESQRQTLLLPRIPDTTKVVKTVKDGSIIYFQNIPGAGVNKGLYFRNNGKWNWLAPSGMQWALPGNSGLDTGSFMGTTDIRPLVFKTNNITRLFMDSATGYVGFKTSTPFATLHNQGTTLLGVNPSVFTVSTNGLLGAAANSVDSFTMISVNTTVDNQYVALPDPSDTTPGRIMFLLSGPSSRPFYSGYNASSAGINMFVWNGHAWAPIGDGVGANNMLPPGKASQYGFNILAGSPVQPQEENVAIGYDAMWNIASTGGFLNAAIGTRAGRGITTQDYNIAIGHDAMTRAINSGSQIAIGDSAMCVSTGDSCIALGAGALSSNTSGSFNTAVGTDALRSVTTGSSNTAVGYQTLANLGGNSSYNSAAGYRAAYNLTSGDKNTAVGAYALAGVTSGSFNTALGYCAGYTDSIQNSATNITNATAIGAFAQIQYSNTIILGSTNPTYASNVGIGIYKPLYKLHVAGNINATSTTNLSSDGRLKKDIQPIKGALNTIDALRPVSFKWNGKAMARQHMPTDKKVHYGFIAQELEKVLTQVVTTANDDMHSKALAYNEIIPVLAEAVKERQQLIERLTEENTALEQQLLLVEELKNKAMKILASKK
ncbi:tail fiber domain-containing protein [Filimonas effusa]|nr:tail fiber domain-containing protein [Filimonas effusa]